MTAPSPPSQQPYFLYRLHVDIEPTDAPVLRDALEDEPFGLRYRIGQHALNRQLSEYELSVNAHSSQRWDDFDKDIEVLSVYLSQYIVGYEMQVRPTAGAPLLDGWKVVGCRGEVVRLLIGLEWNAREEQVVIHQEDIADLTKRWEQLPEWLRNAMRLKYPRLSAL